MQGQRQEEGGSKKRNRKKEKKQQRIPFTAASSLLFSARHVVAPLRALSGHAAVEAGLGGGLNKSQTFLIVFVFQVPLVQHLARDGTVLLASALEAAHKKC